MGNIIKYQNPSSPLINRVNKSKANFVKRLLDPNRKVIQNWVNPLDVSTHKLGWATEDTKQGAFVYPEVQEINGELIDFTHPSHLRSEGMNSAIERKDTVRMTPEQAKWFTENYKQYYPGFKDGGNIHIKPENKGKFTDYCGGKVTQECIQRGKHSSNPITRKRATFAANARTWKHDNGGVLKFKPGGSVNEDSSIDMGEIEASVITPKQSKINRRREIRRAFRSIRNLIKSGEMDSQDVLNAYYGLNEDQRKRALESAMKFSPEGRPDQVLSMMKQNVLKKPRKAFQTLRYIMTGKGEPKFFSYGYDRGYNGLWTLNGENIPDGLVDALVYGSVVNPKIGTRANKKDFGPILNYIKRHYGNKAIQYIQTNPGVTVNQYGITPISYSGSHGSFKTSTPNATINNQGFTLEKGTRNDSTFVRGLDVYDFQPSGYNEKWNKDGMHSVVEKVDEDTTPVAIKTPWVPENEINTIIAHPDGYQPYEYEK